MSEIRHNWRHFWWETSEDCLAQQTFLFIVATRSTFYGDFPLAALINHLANVSKNNINNAISSFDKFSPHSLNDRKNNSFATLWLRWLMLLLRVWNLNHTNWRWKYFSAVIINWKANDFYFYAISFDWSSLLSPLPLAVCLIPIGWFISSRKLLFIVRKSI
jgi:hypothetical protein